MFKLTKQFNDLVKNRLTVDHIISATQVATILGFNRYENNRDLFLKQLKAKAGLTLKGRSSSIEDVNRSVTPCAIGKQFESRAIELFKERYKLDKKNGFTPPYLFTEVANSVKSRYNLKLGGEGDYIFYNAQKDAVLLEIKCLVTRKMDKKVPIHYYLQVQTMLYVYYLLGLPIKYAIYCENIFGKDGKLQEYWENRIDLDIAYFESKVLPILKNYTEIVQEQSKPRKRSREESDSGEDLRSSLVISETFFNKRKRLNNPLVSRLNFRNVYSHFLTYPVIFGTNCLNNYINNNQLRDWYYYRYLKAESSLIKSDGYNHSLEMIPDLLKFIFTDRFSNLNICNIDADLLPSHKEINMDKQEIFFAPIKFSKTVQCLRDAIDIIIGGQLYNPDKGTWVNFDLLIKNKCLQIGEVIKESFDNKLLPNHYTPVKIIKYKYNLNNLTSRKARLELLMQLECLNFYFSGENVYGLIIDSDKRVIAIDFRVQNRINIQYQNAKSWLKTLTDRSINLAIDPPNDNRLFPNSKITTRDHQFEEFKSKLIEKNSELTKLWAISCQKRDKLANLNPSISNVDLLTKHIRKREVKAILGPIYPNIRNMLLANKTGKINQFLSIHRELKALKQPYEIFLDFEFTSKYIYIIGLYIIEPNVKGPVFKQFVAYDFTESSHVTLLSEFGNQIKSLSGKAGDMINCYHWGQVEERLVKKYLPELMHHLNFIDLHEMFVDYHLAIPNCNNYTLKDVAKSLRAMGLISTEWEENTNGYWCNKTLSRIVQENNLGDLSIEKCDGFDEILKYNKTDCKVLYDIVDVFRRKSKL